MAQESQPKQFDQLYKDALGLLKQLIRTQSYSGEEEGTAQLISDFLTKKKVAYKRENNNVWARNLYFDSTKPTILLNSHHDTVKPNKNYTNDPFDPFEKEGKLFGLGSNDAGGALVSLMAVFLYFYRQKDLKYNLIVAASAEEETTGKNGIASILKHFGPVEFALVGEPTEMEMAVAEKALLVLDCVAKGEPSHAAHPNENNAIYKAIKDIQWIQNYTFPKKSKWLGNVKMTTTIIRAGELHNMVPAECHFTIDVRVTDQYSTKEVYKTVQENLAAEVKPRSLLRNSSSIDQEHPIIKAGIDLGRKCYGSPTSSDQAVIPYPSFKMGPGRSQRSHSANEFIYLHEIREGIELYIKLLKNILH